MSRSLIYLVAGARPNFMKIAPIVRALQARADRFEFKIIHTGQHYDENMWDRVLGDLAKWVAMKDAELRDVVQEMSSVLCSRENCGVTIRLKTI